MSRTGLASELLPNKCKIAILKAVREAEGRVPVKSAHGYVNSLRRRKNKREFGVNKFYSSLYALLLFGLVVRYSEDGRAELLRLSQSGQATLDRIALIKQASRDVKCLSTD